jgi:hypothetical protein
MNLTFTQSMFLLLGYPWSSIKGVGYIAGTGRDPLGYVMAATTPTSYRKSNLFLNHEK